MKIRPVGAKLFHAKGWTYEQWWLMKLLTGLCNFATVPSKQLALQNLIICDIDMEVGLQP